MEEFSAALRGEADLTKFLEGVARQLAAVEGRQVIEAFGGLVAAADKAVLTGEFADYVAASLRAAVSTGVTGWRDDDLALVSGWDSAWSTRGQERQSQSGKAIRTGWCRGCMASGSPRTSPGHVPTYCMARVT